MAIREKPSILLTNDDGIRSPGLWAAAEALSELGFVTVVAPRAQSSGSGRSMPITSDGVICEVQVEIRGKTWKVYAVGGSPAQAVQHGIFEITEGTPDLVVAGINYGENVGTGVTISGTVGAALEGASLGIPSLAVSLQTEKRYHLSYSEDVDFTAAAYFTKHFARVLLTNEKIGDVDVLKVEVPEEATPETPWQLTRLSRVKYFYPVRPDRRRLDEPAFVDYEIAKDLESFEEGSDTHALRVLKHVSVTPLSIDMTSRVDLTQLEERLRSWVQPK
jgi:5'-nucleotidase